MNKRQMKRIILASNASYLLHGAQTDCITDGLTAAEVERFHQVQNEIASGWLRQAGFSSGDDLSAEGIVKKVLADG